MSTNYLTIGNRPIICLLCMEQLFGTGNRLIIWILHIDKLFGYCASPNHLLTAHVQIFWLLSIAELFS